MKIEKIKEKIRQKLFQTLGKINGVVSVTLVGSFVDKEDLTGISDIDTVVICKSLDKKLFYSCLNSVENIDLKNCGLSDYSLKINPTFGPLKFDRSNLVVIHLMVYDIDAHRRHVLASPFTCFDWERTKTVVGPSLKEIFPVGMLQYRDFIEARRSLNNYLDDLSNSVISYREYDFDGGDLVEIKKNKTLDKLHQGEYVYHIVRNLIANYLKLSNNKNEFYSNKQIKEGILKLFPESGHMHAKTFDAIAKIKTQRADNYPLDTVEWANFFLKEFEQNLILEWSDSIHISFIRHFKTNLNDRSYLGQGRDPDIDTTKDCGLINASITKLFSSPLRRCVQSAKIIFQDMQIVTDDRLLEFDYGEAEGLSYKQLVMEYPEIAVAWKNSEDPKFPDGENTNDVNDRLNSFLDDLSCSINNNPNESIGIVTHNGILRCLIGNAFGLDMKEWYKLVIPHGIQLEFLFCKNRFYSNISRNLSANILQNIGYSI